MRVGDEDTVSRTDGEEVKEAVKDKLFRLAIAVAVLALIASGGVGDLISITGLKWG